MIKTIDTNEIPDEMLYAGVYAAERCADAGVTDLKDVIYDAIFSALEVAPAVEPAQSAAGPVSKEWDSLSSIGNRLHNISVEQHYAGNEKLSDELGEFASLLWIWDRTRKPTVPPAIPAELRGKILTLCTLAENGLISSVKYEAKQVREMMGEA